MKTETCTPDLTPASADLLRFLKSIADFDGEAYIVPEDVTSAQRGNLTDLKKKGLISTIESDRPGCYWVRFH